MLHMPNTRLPPLRRLCTLFPIRRVEPPPSGGREGGGDLFARVRKMWEDVGKDRARYAGPM